MLHFFFFLGWFRLSKSLFESI